MIQGVDMRPGMRAERDGLHSRTPAVFHHVLAVLLIQAVQKRSMRRKMRHADVQRLRKIEQLSVRDVIEERHGGQCTDSGRK